MNKQTTSAFILILGLLSTVVQASDYTNHCSSGNVIKQEHFEEPGTYYPNPAPQGHRYFEFNHLKIEISEGRNFRNTYRMCSDPGNSPCTWIDGDWQPLFQPSYGAPGLQFLPLDQGPTMALTMSAGRVDN